MHFATPEASWNVAGGEARNERNHRIAREEDCAPEGALGSVIMRPSAPCRGAILRMSRIRWFPLVPRFTTGYIPIVPPGHRAVSAAHFLKSS